MLETLTQNYRRWYAALKSITEINPSKPRLVGVEHDGRGRYRAFYHDYVGALTSETLAAKEIWVRMHRDVLAVLHQVLKELERAARERDALRSALRLDSEPEFYDPAHDRRWAIYLACDAVHAEHEDLRCAALDLLCEGGPCRFCGLSTSHTPDCKLGVLERALLKADNAVRTVSDPPRPEAQSLAPGLAPAGDILILPLVE